MNAFANIWLSSDARPPPSTMSLVVKSSDTLFSVHDFNDDEDNIMRTVSKRLTEALEHEADDIESEASLYTPLPSTIFKKSRNFHNASMYLIKSCIDQLEALVEVHAVEDEKHKIDPFLYRPLSDRYGRIHPDYDMFVIGGSYTDWHKIQKDIEVITLVLNELYNEIHSFNAATCLDIFAEIQINMAEDEEQLSIDVQYKKDLYNRMSDELKYNREEMIKKFEEMKYKVSEMTTEWKNLIGYSNAAVNYTKCWQDSRREQNTLRLKLQEENHHNVVQAMQEKMLLEHLCYDNFKLFCNEYREDQVSVIEKWMDAYDRELDEREVKLLKLKHETEEIINAKEEMQRIYNERAQAIEDWLEYKRVKKEKEDRIALENQAVTRIQAWWRGEMVRKHLGPYAKKKKGKKRDKQNKKKKTKK